MVLLRGLDERGLSLPHQPRLAEGPPARREPARAAALLLARARPPDLRARRASRSCPTRSPTPTSRRARAARGSARSPPSRARCSTAARSSSSAGRRPTRRTRERTSRARTTGAATSWCPSGDRVLAGPRAAPARPLRLRARRGRPRLARGAPLALRRSRRGGRRVRISSQRPPNSRTSWHSATPGRSET